MKGRNRKEGKQWAHGTGQRRRKRRRGLSRNRGGSGEKAGEWAQGSSLG